AAHRRAGRYAQAVADLDRALLLDPDNAFALATRGTLSRDLGRHDEAVADLTRALAIEPDVPWVLAAPGLAPQRAGRTHARPAPGAPGPTGPPGQAGAGPCGCSRTWAGRWPPGGRSDASSASQSVPL